MKASRFDWALMLYKIKQARHLINQTLAAEIEVDPSTIRNWESRRSCPRYDEGAWIVEQYFEQFHEPPALRVPQGKADQKEILRRARAHKGARPTQETIGLLTKVKFT